MRIDNGVIQLGWFDLTYDDAVDFGLPQAARTQYQVFVVGLFGRGFTICVRAKS